MNSSLLFVLLLALSLVAALDQASTEDKIYVQKKRAEYRTELFKFITDQNLKEPLTKVYDDFIACKINANGAFTKITGLFNEIYKDEQQRKTNLVGLASIFVVIDSMEKVDRCAMYEAYVSSEVAFKLPVEINAITFHSSAKRIFALSKCDLHFYAPAKSGRRGYELENVAKRISRKPVQQLKVVDEADYLLTLSDQVLSLHSLTFPFPVKAIVRVKAVTAFTAHVDKKNKDFYITVASKRKFSILKWKDDDFVELSNCDLPIPADNPLIITWSRRCLCYAIRDSYNLIGMSYNSATQAWSGENTKLFPVGDVPCILDISERKMVGFTRGDTVTLRSSDVGAKLHGSSTALSQDVKFTGTLLAVVNDGPYLVGLLPKGVVEIRSIAPSYLIQTITLGKAVMLAPALSGQVCVASAFDVWLLDAHLNLRKNVSHLVNERHFDLAVQLADCGKLFNESEKVEIKSQAALNLFNQRKFEEAFALHAEIKTNVITVLSLFPDLLPERFSARHSPSASDLAENEKKRAMLALSVYLAEARTQLAFSLEQHNKAKNGEKNAVRLSKEDHDRAKTELQIVDTTLLQCYLKIRPMLVDSLLRLNDNSCSFEDAETMLRDAKQLRSLFILYETRRKHQMALSLLKEQAALAPLSDPFFHGVDPTVEYLQTLGNSHLDAIFEYAKWVLAEDYKTGITIFTGDETSDLARNLDRDRILDFLEEECIDAVIPYLEHVVFKWEDESARLHEALLEYYARKVKELLKEYTHAFHDDENVIRAGQEEGDLGVYRRKMLTFLHHSLSYSPNKILVQLNHYAFCEERALILGRLKKHEEALSIYTGVLHDLVAAEEYCRLYYNAADPIDSQVYLHLVRAFVSPSDPQLGTALLVSPDADLPTPTPNVALAIKVLSRHADKMDAVAALSLIPDDSSLCDLSASLTALVRATAQEAAATSIRRALCESACLRVEQRLKEVSSTRVLITSNTQCVHCEKKIATSTFVRHAQTGELEHLYCHERSDRNKIQV